MKDDSYERIDKMWEIKAMEEKELLKAKIQGDHPMKPINRGQANEAFYAWEELIYEGNSDLSDDDREIWVEGYLQGLRDAS